MTAATAPTEQSALPPMALAVRLEALTAAIRALTGFVDSLAAATSEQLAEALGVLDRLAALAAAGRVAVAAARAQRMASPAQRRAARTADWVGQHAPTQRAGGAGVVARAADLIAEADAGPVAEAILDGIVAPGAGLSVMNAFQRVRDRLAEPHSAPAVLRTLLETAERDGVRALNAAVTQLLESHGTPDAVEQDQQSAARRVKLSHGVQEDGGTTRYDLIADSVGRALLEAAIGPLSRPIPGSDGCPDPRSAVAPPCPSAVRGMPSGRLRRRDHRAVRTAPLGRAERPATGGDRGRRAGRVRKPDQSKAGRLKGRGAEPATAWGAHARRCRGRRTPTRAGSSRADPQAGLRGAHRS